MSLKYDYFSDHKMASSHKVIKDINSLSAENWMGAATPQENEELLAALKEARNIEKSDKSFNQTETDQAVENLTRITQQFQKIPANVTPISSPEKVNPNIQPKNSVEQNKNAQVGGSVQTKAPGNKPVTQKPRIQVCNTKRVKMISEKLKAFEGAKDGVVTIRIRASQFVLLRQLLESSCEIFGQASSSNLHVLDPINSALSPLLATKEQIKNDNLKEDKILPVSQPTAHQGSQTLSPPGNSSSMDIQSREMEKPSFLPPAPPVIQGPPAPPVPVLNNSQPEMDYSQEASSPAQEHVFPPPHHQTWSSGSSGPTRGRGSRGQRHNPYQNQNRNSLIQHQVWLRQMLRETDPTRRGRGHRGRGTNWY